uniref:UBN2 domain-containing protein n=1 Tax=Vitis vinifera TaxID=29760 RepID=A5BWL8_VITVI|nr:hypothetical protein VITISV_015072 [Vitis vinifera]
MDLSLPVAVIAIGSLHLMTQLFDHQSNPRLRRVIWNPWQSNGKLKFMKNQALELHSPLPKSFKVKDHLEWQVLGERYEPLQGASVDIYKRLVEFPRLIRIMCTSKPSTPSVKTRVSSYGKITQFELMRGKLMTALGAIGDGGSHSVTSASSRPPRAQTYCFRCLTLTSSSTRQLLKQRNELLIRDGQRGLNLKYRLVELLHEVPQRFIFLHLNVIQDTTGNSACGGSKIGDVSYFDWLDRASKVSNMHGSAWARWFWGLEWAFMASDRRKPYRYPFSHFPLLELVALLGDCIRRSFSSCLLSILACQAWNLLATVADWDALDILVIMLVCFLHRSHRRRQCCYMIRVFAFQVDLRSRFDRGPVKDNETIVEMITWFTDLVNGLEALGKTYKESEKGMKILRSLPSKWHTKVTAIQEAKDLTKLPLEKLIGSLMTYEINLAKKQQESEDKKKKSITLKATTKEEEEVEEEKQSEEDEYLALVTRKFNKFMRGEKFRGRRFTSRRDLSKKESSFHGD